MKKLWILAFLMLALMIFANEGIVFVADTTETSISDSVQNWLSYLIVMAVTGFVGFVLAKLREKWGHHKHVAYLLDILEAKFNKVVADIEENERPKMPEKLNIDQAKELKNICIKQVEAESKDTLKQLRDEVGDYATETIKNSLLEKGVAELRRLGRRLKL